MSSPNVARAKIVCTIGPASESTEALDQLIDAGMAVARLNFSHGSREGHAAVIRRIRELAGRRELPVAVLQDLAGPKIRIGNLAEGAVTLEAGATFTFTARAVPGDAESVSVSHAELPRDVGVGDPILLNDGNLELEVIETRPEEVVCRVVVGGRLTPRKGINLPTRSVSGPVLTEKDRQDLVFGLDHGVDFVALSYVRTAEDVREAKRFIAERGGSAPVIAKIERPEALDRLAEILEAADGVMVARGDLGVETPIARVPKVQKAIIARANQAGRPVITATQMLQSMVSSRRPTRAEVSDVANAILDGSDAVMLSEETAVGAHVVEAVRTMRAVVEETETALPFETWRRRLSPSSDADALARAACGLAEDLQAAAILVCGGGDGTMARAVAKYRPDRPVVAVMVDAATCRRLALTWGVRPLVGAATQIDDCTHHVRATMPGGPLVIVACDASGDAETAGLIRVEW